MGKSLSPGPAAALGESGAGMRRLVDRPKALGRDLRVHLGRRDAGVAEQLLDDPDVGAPLQHVRGARMTEDVRGEAAGQPGPLPGRADDHPAALPAQPSAPHVQDYGLPVTAGGASGPDQLRAAVGEVRAERVTGRAPDRDDALLAALAEHAHQAVLEVEVA